MKKLTYIIMAALLGTTFLVMNNACTKYEAPDMVAMDGFDSDSVISTAIHRKVLWINIEGAVGSEMEKLIPTDGNIARMLKKSKYSWAGMSDNRILDEIKDEDPVTWSTMLTGVIKEKHYVTDDSYMANAEYDPNNPDEKIIQYPNIFHYIAENDPDNPTLCVTPWPTLNRNMLNSARTIITTSGDSETKEEVVKHLQEETDLKLVLVGFSGMFESGKSGGFTGNNPQYVAALKEIDGYIGEFLQTMDERENAFFEDWLVIITSNHGGTVDGKFGGNSPEERNTFGIFYYSHYDELKMVGSKLYGAHFERNKSKAMVFDTVSNDIRYALKPDTPFSLELVMRMLPRKDGTYYGDNWNTIISRGNWGLFRQRSTVSIYVTDKNSTLEYGINAFNDPQWHNYTLSLTKNSPKRDWRIALDGKSISAGNTNVIGASDNNSSIYLGEIPTPYLVSEIRLWKKAFTENEILQQATLLDIPKTDERYKDLLAYWKLNPDEVVDVSKPDTIIIRNQIEDGLDLFYINLDKKNTSPLKDRAFTELPNTFISHREKSNIMMENTLVVPQILYWLNLSANTVFDGYRFIDNYAHSEDWRDAPQEE